MDRAVRRRFDEVEQKLNALLANSSGSSSVELEDLKSKLIDTISVLEVNLSKVMDRVVALENKPEKVPVDISLLEKRVLTLENKPVPKTLDLEKRITELEKLARNY